MELAIVAKSRTADSLATRINAIKGQTCDCHLMVKATTCNRCTDLAVLTAALEAKS